MKAMKALSTKTLKLAFLAATAGVAASAAEAAPTTSPAAPTYVATAVAPAPSDAEPELAAVKTAGLAAFFVGALALGARLIGKRRMDAAVAFVRPYVSRAVQAVDKTIKSARRAVAAPIRAGLLALGLVVFALTGIDVFNIEWTVGLALGAVLVLAALARPLRLKPSRRRSG
jgi:hypothetical protein